MQGNELKASRGDHFLAAEKLIKAAREAGKDLAGTELKEYDGHIGEIKRIDALLDRSGSKVPRDRTMPDGTGYQIVGPGTAVANENNWTDPRTGQPVAVLKPEQQMIDIASFGEPGLSLGAYARGIVTGKWSNAEREFQAMTEGSLGGGGYLLPSPLSSQIIDRVRNRAVMVKAGALTIPMETQTLSMARVAASGGDVTPMWHTESAAITASDMTFEKITFTAQTLAALCSLSVELFEDCSNLDTILADAISKVLAIELDRACLRGTGVAPQPKGILNQAGVTIDSTTFTTNGSVISASAPTNAVAWDWLSKQISALWGANEAPNAAIYSARTAGELDLLRATTGEVLPPPGSVGNLQLLFTNSIPNNLTQGTNSDCSEAYVGNFAEALIGMRTQLVLEFSRYATVGSTSMFSTMQVGVRCYLRADFQLARPGAFRVVTGIR